MYFYYSRYLEYISKIDLKMTEKIIGSFYFKTNEVKYLNAKFLTFDLLKII